METKVCSERIDVQMSFRSLLLDDAALCEP